MLAGLSDAELLKSGDNRSFKILFDRYWSPLYVKARSRLKNESDAKDVLQDVFTTLWGNRHHIFVEDTLAPYLFTAVKYAILKKIERDSKKGIIHPLDVATLASVKFSHEEELHYKELEKLIRNEVEKLPDRMKQIYLLSRDHYLKNKEIAQTLNLSEQTVKNMLSTAIGKLRTKFGNYKLSIFLI